MKSTLYTIGHSNATLDSLLAALRTADVRLLIDIRRLPVSRFAHFTRSRLEPALARGHIAYRWMGESIGGTPASLRTGKAGHALAMAAIAIFRTTPEWHAGIEELVALVSAEDGVCIMCSEGDHTRCHRSAVAGDVAALLPGLNVVHLPSKAPQPAGQIQLPDA